MGRGSRVRGPLQFRRYWRGALISRRRSGRRRTKFVPPVVCGRRVGCGIGNVKAVVSNGGIGRVSEVEMFPVFPVLFLVCSQSWRNEFCAFPVFQIAWCDPMDALP